MRVVYSAYDAVLERKNFIGLIPARWMTSGIYAIPEGPPLGNVPCCRS